jgi:hypothetical protein
MSVTTKAKLKSPAPDAEIISAADTFLTTKAAKSEAEKAYEKSKAVLVGFLGDASCKALSDGRTVSKMKQHVDAEKEPRKAFDKTIVSVSPKPAA